MNSQTITFGLAGQTLFVDCPRIPTAGISVEVRREFDESNALATDGPISVEGDRQILADSGIDETNPWIVNIDNTDQQIVSGRSYLIEGQNNSEWIDIVEVRELAVFLRHPLSTNYGVEPAPHEALSARIRSPRMVVAVDAAWSSDETNLVASDAVGGYRVTWIYGSSAGEQSFSSRFDLVKPSGLKTHVTPQDVDDYANGFISTLLTGQQPSKGQRIIEVATTEVYNDLRAAKVFDQARRLPGFVQRLIIKKSVFLAMQSKFLFGNGDLVVLDSAESKYASDLRTVISRARSENQNAKTPLRPLFTR